MRLFHQSTKLPIDKNVFVSIISGSEAGIATTSAIIAGLVIGTSDRNIVIVSAIVAVFVQAFNSAVTSTMALQIIDEIEDSRHNAGLLKPLTKTALQFTTHIVAGVAIILPIVYMQDLAYALVSSIAIAIVFLIWIGLIVGIIVHKSPLRYAFESLITGALIIMGGIIAGIFINN